jgi:pyruvate/2-oxoglutarate/acetoin dehydrogenase E1 component
MHAEVVNGMDVLAVRDAVIRAAELCRTGEGPVLIEASTYRYYGHSLSDPRNEYRTREEEEAWRAVDPIENLSRQLVAAGVLDEARLGAIRAAAAERNARAAKRASEATDPDPADVLDLMYAATMSHDVPPEFSAPRIYETAPVPKVTEAGMLQRDALREAMVEEMTRDSRVIFYGEDVADYGGAFKASKNLLETFGRDRVFNTPISEAAICGTGVGAAMAGLRPVVELMYMDFALMASDQIANQAGKWHYMSGAQTTVPLVIRASVGAGKGYGGQHSQSLESIFTHTPGLVVIYPATAADAKGLLKSAIRSDDPVLFCESQALYAERGPVPDDPDLLVPIGVARVAREGSDATIVAWGPAVLDAMTAAETLAGEGIECDVIDLRTLVPLDMETVLASARKTGRCVVAAQAVLIGSYVNEIVARVVAEAFDDLDAPVARIGAANGISPQAEALEEAFLPHATDIATAVRGLI